MVAIAETKSKVLDAELFKVALDAYRPGKVVVRVESRRGDGPSVPAGAHAMLETQRGGTPFAIMCAGNACAQPTENSVKLADLIRTFEIGANAGKVDANAQRAISDRKQGNTSAANAR